MYGYEEASGLGGLVAQAPANPYFAGALRIRSPGSMVIGDAEINPAMPYALGAGLPGGMVASGGGAVATNPQHQLGSWREILDPYNSPAAWVLILLLLAYGYVHVSYRRGRVSAGGGL